MDTSAFAGFAGDEETEGAGGEKRSATARPGRRGRKQKNVFKEMVGAIVGGFGGLVIGYWVLNFFFGPRMDFMNVWLPFVPHTQKYWEGEADPSAKADADADGSSPSGADDAAGMAAEEPSSRPQQPVWPDEPSSPRGPPPDDFGFASMDEGPEPSEQLAGIDAPKIELELSPDPEPTEGLRRPPSIRASQLGDALKAANEALRGEGASGEIGEGEYEQLCELGRRLTFVKPGGPQVGDRKQAVQKMLEELAADPVAVRQISQLAMAPLEDIDGPDRGVLVAGVIGPINEKNGLFAAALRPMGMDKTFVLASTRPLALPGGRAVLVLGSTVHNPTENVINWEAERPLIVWHGMGVPIPQEERPASPPTDQTRQKPDPDPKPTPSPQPEGGAGPGEAPPPAAAPGAETDSTGSAAPEPGQSAEPEAEPAADEGAGVA